MAPDAIGRGWTGSIAVEQVTQRFSLPREEREFTAVQDVSFDVRGGEFVAIVGPSGCGKSTLLALVAGLVPVTEGRITLDGEAVSGVNPRLGSVFQRDALFPWKAVAENVGEAFPPDSLVTRAGVARVIETMRTVDAVPASLKMEPESVYDNKYVMKALGR
jgi:NitT/TauT family transport system ATP-binding protein